MNRTLWEGPQFLELLDVPRPGRPQKAILNSAQQATNALRKLSILPGVLIPSGAVLLVDDIVDSRWTMTVAGSLLRERGSGPVHPYALAVASQRGAS